MTETITHRTYIEGDVVPGDGTTMRGEPVVIDADEEISLDHDYEASKPTTEADIAVETMAARVPLDELALKEERDLAKAASAPPTPTVSVLDTEPQTPGLTLPSTESAFESIAADPLGSADIGTDNLDVLAEETEYTLDGETADPVDEGYYDDSETNSENVAAAAAKVQEAAEQIEDAVGVNLDAAQKNSLEKNELAVKRAELELDEAEKERAEVYEAAADEPVDESDDGIDAITEGAFRGKPSPEVGVGQMLITDADHTASPAVTAATLDGDDEIKFEDDTPLAVTLTGDVDTTSRDTVDTDTILSPRKRSFIDDDDEDSSLEASTVASKRVRGSGELQC